MRYPLFGSYSKLIGIIPDKINGFKSFLAAKDYFKKQGQSIYIIVQPNAQ